MIRREKIQEFVNRVVKRFQPRKVILFGSYACGIPTEDSDVDIMLVMPHRGPGSSLATRVLLACPRDFSLDLMVRSPAEIRRRVEMGDAFLTEVTTKGVVLHESRDTRVGGQGRVAARCLDMEYME
jgi:predicted nucleotidyltransferase